MILRCWFLLLISGLLSSSPAYSVDTISVPKAPSSKPSPAPAAGSSPAASGLLSGFATVSSPASKPTAGSKPAVSDGFNQTVSVSISSNSTITTTIVPTVPSSDDVMTRRREPGRKDKDASALHLGTDSSQTRDLAKSGQGNDASPSAVSSAPALGDSSPQEPTANSTLTSGDGPVSGSHHHSMPTLDLRFLTWIMIVVVLIVSFAPVRRFLMWGMKKSDPFTDWYRAKKRKKQKTSGINDMLSMVRVEDRTSVVASPRRNAVEMMDFSTKPKFFPTLNKRAPNCILNNQLIEKIVTVLPERVRLRDWRLLYNSYEHGQNLRTLYRRCANQGPVVIVVEDSAKMVFGGFMMPGILPSSSYYGIGESFVMTLSPQFMVFRWTKANSYFLLAKPDCIAMGGGDHFAWCLDEPLRQGTTLPSQTFGSPCLASTEDFVCFGVEVWGFEDG